MLRLGGRVLIVPDAFAARALIEADHLAGSRVEKSVHEARKGGASRATGRSVPRLDLGQFSVVAGHARLVGNEETLQADEALVV
jgi:hypothetical protein